MAEWMFDPEEDITAYEVALLLAGFLSPSGSLYALESDMAAKVPKVLRRHFRQGSKRWTDDG